MEHSRMTPALLMSYFLVAWQESFPITATSYLLLQELNVSLPTISSYYAVTFMPFMWKPLYGWISDNFPMFKYHRSPYIFICGAGSLAGYLAFAVWVHSPAMAFIIATIQGGLSAFLQLMLGGFLVDIVRHDIQRSAWVQSLATGGRWAGTLSAQVAALCVYAHGAGGSLSMKGALITARQAIALTGVAPLLIALLVPFLHEAPKAGNDVVTRSNRRCIPGWLTGSCKSLSLDHIRFSFVVILIQSNLAVIGCQNLMGRTQWYKALICCAAVSLALGSCTFFYGRCRTQPSAEVESQYLENDSNAARSCLSRWARISIFCFMVNAIPSSSVSLNVLQLKVLSSDGYQSLALISSFASLCASFAFGGGFRRWSIRSAIGVSTCLSIFAALMPLPFVLAVSDTSVQHSLWSIPGALGIAASALGSIASVFTVLPVETLVTAASGLEEDDRSTTALAVFLACYSFGATVGGLIAAPILTAIGLDGKNWQALPAWIVATAFAKLLVILLLPLLPLSARRCEEHPEPSSGSLAQGRTPLT